MRERWTYRMFGLVVSSGFPLPGLAPVDAAGPHRTDVDLAPAADVEQAFSGSERPPYRLAQGDGTRMEMFVGVASDVLIRYEDRVTFFIDAHGASVLCAPSDFDALDWQRVLLDTVLLTAGLQQGLEALHAGAVALGGGVVAVTAATGSGKSTLCAELIRRGARFFSDDLVFLSRNGEGIRAHPGPPLMNLPRGAPALGRELAVFGEEAWVVVEHGSQAPRSLKALIALDRRAALEGASIEREGSPVPLLAAALHSGETRERLEARFDLVAELARTLPVYRLSASRDVPAVRLAELVESAVTA